MVGGLVGGLARIEQPPELAQRIRPHQERPRASLVTEPDERSLRPKAQIDEACRWSQETHNLGIRHPAAARREDHVAHQAELFGQSALELAEVSLTLLAEDLGDGLSLPPLDLEIEVEKSSAEAFRDGLSHSGLASAR